MFRIYDTCLASGIEAIFTFSIGLLQKNEDILLSMKFDEILVFLKQRVFDRYKVRPLLSYQPAAPGTTMTERFHSDRPTE